MLRKLPGVLAKVGASAGVGLGGFGLFHHTMQNMPPAQKEKLKHDFFAKYPARRFLPAPPKPGRGPGNPW